MTYAIVARDPIAGEIGGAVQTHFFNAGAVVLWPEAGTGIVAKSTCEWMITPNRSSSCDASSPGTPTTRSCSPC